MGQMKKYLMTQVYDDMGSLQDDAIMLTGCTDIDSCTCGDDPLGGDGLDD